MKVDYVEEQKKLTSNDYIVYYDTILDNKYIHYTPYPQQAMAIMGHSRRKCIGGNAFGGKSLLGYILACQWVDFPHYRCLILRNTFDDVRAPGGIVDYIDKHCAMDYYDSDGNLVIPKEEQAKHNHTQHFFRFPSGAEIWYNSSDRPDDRARFRSRSFDNIIVDEASELPPQNLSYLTRSNRSTEADNSPIPLHINFISNPSLKEGTKFLRENFVDDGSAEPFYEIRLEDNLYAPKDYREQLAADLDPVDIAFQLEGRWDYVPDQGMLISKQDYYDNTIQPSDIKYNQIDHGVIGVDLASEGDDSTVATLINHFSTGRNVIQDSIETTDPFPEEHIIQFIEKVCKKQPLDLVLIEKGPGADADYSERYWYTELGDMLDVFGFQIDFRRAVSSKYARARPSARSIRNGITKINADLPTYQRLLEEYMYVHPDKTVLEQYPSPDAMDSVSIGFNLSNIINGGITQTGYESKSKSTRKTRGKRKQKRERPVTYGTSYDSRLNAYQKIY